MSRSIAAPKVYAIADSGALGLEALPDAVVIMAEAGVEWVQLRLKNTAGRKIYRTVEQCVRRLEGSNARLWLNDRADLAALFPVSGVHVGQEDLPPKAVRQVIGRKQWIGRSTHNLHQLQAADRDPEVDVVALGPIFDTRTKKNPQPTVGLALLEQGRRLTQKCLVAIGGIDPSNLQQVFAAGADSIAVVGAVCKGNVHQNCQRLLAMAKELQ